MAKFTMTAAAYTPGPWKPRRHIATSCHDIDAADGLPVAFTSGYRIDEATEAANARVLAAAPDMLDLLREIEVPAVDVGGGDLRVNYDLMGRIRAAIAKATGAQS